ncbi:hypothetical protein B0J12DRAFT_750737 [Macrophomina phaseolina]|uniref:Alpha/beta hydrolase fold-3 domain-containing protein n=1 Tax=Macrophomina phaseolina TaxID=35725 RepID=A0ABQ8GE80_9PEZI|nr:hypothetical protein B0J12DRAFT_750737 [Macrophomina phaseolina]
MYPTIGRPGTAAHAPTIAIVEYGLAPALPYPGQLIQAIEALRHLLRSTADGGAGHAARDVVVVGGSAGGNLAAGMLAHLRWVSPYAGALEGFSATDGSGVRLGGAVLVSPWVGMAFSGGSYAQNAGVDSISVAGMAEARDKWRPRAGEVWADMVGGRSLADGGAEEGLAGFWREVFQGGEQGCGEDGGDGRGGGDIFG